MSLDNDSVRDAGRRIAESGLTDDVRHISRTNRERLQGGDTDDADEPAERPQRRDRRDRDEDDRQPKSRRQEPDEDLEEDDQGRQDDDEDDDDADLSNREDDGDEDGEEGDEEDDDADGDDRNRKDVHEVKVNGETLKVTLDELKQGYSRTKDYHQKTQAVAAKSRELNQSHAQVAQAYARKLQETHAIVAGLSQMLVGDINSAEMQALRRSNPQEWMIARQDISDRIEGFNAIISNLQQEHERHRTSFTQTQQTNSTALIEQEMEQLSRFIPDWAEGKNGKPSGRERLSAYLDKNGFNRAEYAGITDHRMLAIADKARRWDEMQASRDKMPKPKAKPLPKRIPPGRSEISSGKERERTKDRNEFRTARDRVAKTGDMRDGAAAINALISRDEKRARRRGR